MRGNHQDTEAREVLDAKVPLIIVQFHADDFCNAVKYPNWYGQIIAAVQARRAEPSFFCLNLPGDHNCAEELATHSWWETYGPPPQFLDSFWTAVTGD